MDITITGLIRHLPLIPIANTADNDVTWSAVLSLAGRRCSADDCFHACNLQIATSQGRIVRVAMDGGKISTLCAVPAVTYDGEHGRSVYLRCTIPQLLSYEEVMYVTCVMSPPS